MAQDYLTKVSISAAGNTDVGLPTNAVIVGVISDVAVTLKWKFNNETSDLMPVAGQMWMPPLGFAPGPFSSLVITTTAATNVSIIIRK